MTERTIAVTLRRGPVFVSVDLPEHCTQNEWDAIGALMTFVVQTERKLSAHPERPDFTT